MKLKFITLVSVLAGTVTACDSSTLNSDPSDDVGTVENSTGDSNSSSELIDPAGEDGQANINSDPSDGVGTVENLSGGSDSSSGLIGSLGEDGQANTAITMTGLIKLEPNNTSTDFSRGLFGRLNPPLTAAEISLSYAPLADTCEVTETDNTISPGPVLRINEHTATLISAGENLTLSGAVGTLATLDRFDIETGPFYRTDVAIGRTEQNGLLIDIPGDQFPQFSGVSFTNVPALQVTSPTIDEAVTADTQFTWNANNVTGSVFELYSGGIAGDGSSITISCTLIDDGSFRYSADILTQIGNYQADWKAFLRVSYNAVIQDDAVLITANSVAPE